MTHPEAVPATERGLYGIGAAGLALEGIVLLLAAPAVISLERGDIHWVRVGYMLALGVLLFVGAGMLRRPHGKTFGSALQVLAIAGGIVTWPMYILGVAFGAMWIYWLRLWSRHGYDASVSSS